MSKSVYVVHHGQQHNDYLWEKEITEINSINPDIVVCLCFEEYDVVYLFRNFFPKVSEWAVSNNKLVKVLVSNPNNVELFPNVVTESTFGFYYCMIGTVQHAIDNQLEVNPKLCDKVYTCYNNNPKFERALLIEELSKRHLMQHGIVTFTRPAFVHNDNDGNKFPGWHYHNGDRLLDEIDFELNACDEYTANELPRSYMRGLIDLVSESNIRPTEFFTTEKTAKPIATLKPFICLANVDYHRFLTEEYGLELYDELFDYSFDKEPNLNKRISMIVDNIERIVEGYTDDFKHSMYETLLPKLLRNRQRFIDYGSRRDKIMIDTIEHAVNNNYNIYGSDVGIDELTKVLGEYKRQNWL